MIRFFQNPAKTVLAVEVNHALSAEDTRKLVWLFSEATPIEADSIEGWFVGPRKEMITPWSSNAVEIALNVGITGITRIEEYFPVADENAAHDPMLQRMYNGLNQTIFNGRPGPERLACGLRRRWRPGRRPNSCGCGGGLDLCPLPRYRRLPGGPLGGPVCRPLGQRQADGAGHVHHRVLDRRIGAM